MCPDVPCSTNFLAFTGKISHCWILFTLSNHWRGFDLPTVSAIPLFNENAHQTGVLYVLCYNPRAMCDKCKKDISQQAVFARRLKNYTDGNRKKQEKN